MSPRSQAHPPPGELVSVIIPTYFRNDALDEAIRSVRKQTHSDTEIIVVDDSGEGHAGAVIEGMGDITYLQMPENRGPQVARERGLEEASGKYIQFLDDDDSLRERSIERRIGLLRDNSDVGVVYCGIDRENDGLDMPHSERRGDVLKHALAFQLAPCVASTMLVDQTVLERVRPLNPRYTGAGDIAIKIDLAARTKFDFVDEPLLRAERSDDSFGVSKTAIDSRRSILEDYAELYASQPPWVKKTAIANTKLLEGRWYLTNNVWSADAIRAFGQALYHTPDVTALHVGEFLASMAGRPGREAAQWIKSEIFHG